MWGRKGLPDSGGSGEPGPVELLALCIPPDSSPPFSADQCPREGLACLHGLSGPLTRCLLVGVGLGEGTQSLLSHESAGLWPRGCVSVCVCV